MQMDWIETFLDLCETRSFNRTAERMGVTQSTVSGRVKALEATLGVRLLARSRAGTDLSTDGLRFEPHARAVARAWAEGRRAVRQTGEAPMALRVGLQHDLVSHHVGDWVDALRTALPDAALYVELDYSSQICTDILGGQADFGLVFTPRPHPDLHLETVGALRYRMVSTEVTALADVDSRRYILPNYAPAFARTHAERLPALSTAALSSGQSAVVAEMLESIGGTSYLHEETAKALAQSGQVSMVDGAPDLEQQVCAVMHLRNRHRSTYRRMTRLAAQRLSSRKAQ